MSVVFEINRDFPYQVALSFDEEAMDLLDWLESCEFQWDMYVDLPENTVDCFRTLDRRFGIQAEVRKCAARASSRPRAIDRGWPHQVALPARLCERGGYRRFTSSAKT